MNRVPGLSAWGRAPARRASPTRSGSPERCSSWSWAVDPTVIRGGNAVREGGRWVGGNAHHYPEVRPRSGRQSQSLHTLTNKLRKERKLRKINAAHSVADPR